MNMRKIFAGMSALAIAASMAISASAETKSISWDIPQTERDRIGYTDDVEGKEGAAFGVQFNAQAFDNVIYDNNASKEDKDALVGKTGSIKGTVKNMVIKAADGELKIDDFEVSGDLKIEATDLGYSGNGVNFDFSSKVNTAKGFKTEDEYVEWLKGVTNVTADFDVVSVSPTVDAAENGEDAMAGFYIQNKGCAPKADDAWAWISGSNAKFEVGAAEAPKTEEPKTEEPTNTNPPAGAAAGIALAGIAVAGAALVATKRM